MIKGKWAVVKVESGIPVTVEVYLKWEDAKKREKYYRENMNLDNDETGVFELIYQHTQ